MDDPHVWASALFDEVVALGYSCSYPSFARQLRLVGAHEQRALTPLFWTHINPYGRFQLDMTTRLDLTQPPTPPCESVL